MKIFTGAQIHELDQYTIEHEPISSVDLMERAAKALTHAIVEEWPVQRPVMVFAGPGNNGGDALAVARMLAEQDYVVSVYLFNVKGTLSPDCTINKQRLIDCHRVKSFIEVTKDFSLPTLEKDMLVVDGLFGTGLNKPLSSGFASLVDYINQSPSQVVSIDMPSGLMCEDNTYNTEGSIIRANKTLTLHSKKLSMLFSDTQAYLGSVKVLDIRLSPGYAATATTPFQTLEENDVRKLLRPRGDFANKGTMGTALLIAGSYGMSGAAVLAAKACLRSGVGKLVVHTPVCNYNIMQISVPEAVVQLDDDNDCFSQAVDADDFDAIGMGPGMGRHEGAAIAFFDQMRCSRAPMVVDADAINCLANHRAWISQVPSGIVFTPHPVEFDRLAGSPSTSDYERLMRAINMAKQLEGYILLKGHYSALCMPNGQVVFNITGNAGMATAGSGDVLTGIITALLARGYTQENACLIGMYLHGLAGDLAVRHTGKESLIASDLIDYLPQAFLRLED